MCGCKDKKCGGCSGSGEGTASLESQMADLQATVDALSQALQPFLCGYPIMLVDQPDDIEQFDLETGKGTDCWEGWVLMIGGTHYSTRKKKNITVENWIDRFIVMAGGTYERGDTGGAATVTLTEAQLPAHKHAITDPGHTHTVTDPGHSHQLTDPGHEHVLVDPGHTHEIDDHYHRLGEEGTSVFGTNYNSGTGPFRPAAGYTGSDTNYDGLISDIASLTPSTENADITMNNAFTGIQMDNAFTGITLEDADTGITETENTGGGEEHENLPPYYAAFYVQYIG